MEVADLGEVESRDPEDCWLAMVHPVLEKLQPLQEVIDVASQGFQAGVGPLCPVVWHLGSTGMR